MGEIKTAYPLIHNKVTSPHYVTLTLRRARLLDWLTDHADCRAIVIAAEAGYGKTTLLWQWEKEVDFPCYWYKLDRSDRDWSLHISYLIEAIAQRHPGFGLRAHSMLLQLGGPGSSRPGVAAFLLAEMHETLTEPCTFVIDDWQFVASQTEVRGLWNQILRDAPPTCRFVFLSRAKPQLQFARFRMHGGYGELRTDALRFSESEIDALFRDIYSDPLERSELIELDRRTEGWAASLQLVEFSLRDKNGPAERSSFIESITAATDSDLFTFLAEEVLDQQSDETRNFLLCTSVLQQITPDLAERMTGVRDGALLLADLEQRGLFTNRLADEEGRYRYHALFRDFLERRLTVERSEAEVLGLHIHAASYYETSLQWPQAIHHYLRAGLQRQAARLIAKYGESVVGEGRLGLIDEWLCQLPTKTIRDNARLSLLHGEALGTIRGEWDAALAALKKGRMFFERKGDRRMAALADLKLSTHFNYRGQAVHSVQAARRGLALAGEDDYEIRLRLRGNLAITETWLESLQRTERDCEELVHEARSRGLLHYAAIGYHNLGLVQRWLGRLTESLSNFEEADRFWGATPSSPFGDNADFAETLLAVGETGRAEVVAQQGIVRTRRWPRPNAEAEFGLACVLLQRGEFSEAARLLRRILSKREILGALEEPALALLINVVYLGELSGDELEWASEALLRHDRDPRLSASTSAALAVAAHARNLCSGECATALSQLRSWEKRGARFMGVCGLVQLTPLLMEHDPVSARTDAVRALAGAVKFSAAPHLKWWLRRFAPFSTDLARDRGASPLLRVAAEDATFWIPEVVKILPSLEGAERAEALAVVRSGGTTDIAGLLRDVPGDDVGRVRSEILRSSATRLYVRAFGPLSVHRGGWDGPEIMIDRRRLRLLIGLLVANRQRTLTRDMAIETLWPDHDPAGGVNNLNQAVFQLRRHLNSGSRDPDRPQYVVSSAESLSFDSELIISDLDEVRRLASLLQGASNAHERRSAAVAMVSLIRGEFLADLRYEDWATGVQMSVAAEVREPLLGIASASTPDIPAHVSLRAAEVLTEFDPFDESAHVAMARKLHEMGRRAAARRLISEFAIAVEQELQAPPSHDLHTALIDLGGLPVPQVH